MLSERHINYRAEKQLDSSTLSIKNKKIAQAYQQEVCKTDFENTLMFGFFALSSGLFNLSLCLFLPEHSLRPANIIYLILITIFFLLHMRAKTKPLYLYVTGPLAFAAALINCGQYEVEPQI